MTSVKLLGLIIIIISLLTLVLNHKTFGQTFPEKELIGTWVVNTLENQMSESKIPPDQKEMMSKMERAFLDSKFIFQADKKCVFEFSFEEIGNKKWTLEVRQ